MLDTWAQEPESTPEVLATAVTWASHHVLRAPWGVLPMEWPGALTPALEYWAGLPEKAAWTHTFQRPLISSAKGRQPKDKSQATLKQALVASKQQKRAASQDREDDPSYTTVMLKNVPSTYSRELLVMTLVAAGFHKLFNFVYLPVEFKKKKLLGYAFVNFVDHETAVQFKNKMHGFAGWLADAQGRQLEVDGRDVKVAEVRWGPLHDKDKHIERYRNSDLMHPSVPDEYKPIAFGEDGEPEMFPAPDASSRLKVPRPMQADRPVRGV